MNPTADSIILGTWTFAGDSIWGPSAEAECSRVVHAALDAGVRWFDTAPNYGEGRSEEVLGKALAGRPEARIASKIKIEGRSDRDIRESVHHSLRRVGRDSLDLIQIHWPGTSPEETRAALEVLSDLQKRGQVNDLGVCNFGSFDLEETRDFGIVSNQMPLGPLWRLAEEDIGPATKERGLRGWAYASLQQGLLSGKYPDLESFPKGRQRTRHFTTLREESARALTHLLSISRDADRSLPELAMGFTLSRPFVDAVIVGARSVGQLESLIRGTRDRLAAETIVAIEEATNELLRAARSNPDMFNEVSRVRFVGPDGRPARQLGS